MTNTFFGPGGPTAVAHHATNAPTSAPETALSPRDEIVVVAVSETRWLVCDAMSPNRISSDTLGYIERVSDRYEAWTVGDVHRSKRSAHDTLDDATAFFTARRIMGALRRAS